LEKKKERKACLAEGEKRLAVFLVVQGRPTCGWLQQRRRRCGGYSGAKEANEGGGKKTGEMLFFPTLASNFLMLNASNSPLFIRSGRGTLFLY